MESNSIPVQCHYYNPSKNLHLSNLAECFDFDQYPLGICMLKDNTIGVGIYCYITEFQNKVYAAIMSEMMQRMGDSNGQKLTKELFPLIIENFIISSWITLTSELEKHFKKVQNKHLHFLNL